MAGGQDIQHEQYAFPYHYLPSLSRGDTSFSSSRRWGFSLSYVTALRLIFDTFKANETMAHLDIGCGDGALLHHLRKRYPQAKLSGIDYDANAIEWARMFNADIEFFCEDLHTVQFTTVWQSASLIEVIEHIPPDSLDHFMDGVRGLLPAGALLVVTVPHKNRPVAEKHYQHFDFALLRRTLEPRFKIDDMFGFDFLPLPERLYRKFLTKDRLHIESSVINRFRLAHQLGRKDRSEKDCGRIFAVARAQ